VKRRLVVGPIAEREVEEAARWYEARAKGLGQAFVDEVLRVFDAIEEGPEDFPLLRDPYRRKLLQRFPYIVIYKVTARRVYVRAVAHGRRRPGYWDI
jgi:plasmid stabilization system protein ParE